MPEEGLLESVLRMVETVNDTCALLQRSIESLGNRVTAIEEPTTAGSAERDKPCDHSESLYGRCVACGMTWEQQAATRAAGPDDEKAETFRRGWMAGAATVCEGNGHEVWEDATCACDFFGARGLTWFPGETIREHHLAEPFASVGPVAADVVFRLACIVCSQEAPLHRVGADTMEPPPAGWAFRSDDEGWTCPLHSTVASEQEVDDELLGEDGARPVPRVPGNADGATDANDGADGRVVEGYERASHEGHETPVVASPDAPEDDFIERVTTAAEDHYGIAMCEHGIPIRVNADSSMVTVCHECSERIKAEGYDKPKASIDVGADGEGLIDSIPHPDVPDAARYEGASHDPLLAEAIEALEASDMETAYRNTIFRLKQRLSATSQGDSA